MLMMVHMTKDYTGKDLAKEIGHFKKRRRLPIKDSRDDY